MTFTRLVLHNFGVYRGQHVCTFDSGDRKRPVVLIGGLNGAGKSTLMDAIQLALFGKLARCAGRRTLAYEDYLQRTITRNVHPQEARIQLEFLSHIAGKPTIFCLDRSWRSIDGRVREHFEVRRDDVVDSVLSDSWLEHIDTWLPQNVSQIFFFDGEQLEALADASTSSGVLRAAVEGLLGLDLVSRLGADLSILEQRKSLLTLAPDARDEVDSLARKRRVVAETRSKIRLELGAASNALLGCRSDLHALDTRVAHEGGDLFDRRRELEIAHQQLESRAATAEQQLRELAEGDAPFLLVQPLLEAVCDQATVEEVAARSSAVGDVLKERDEWLVSSLGAVVANVDIVSQIETLLTSDRTMRLAAGRVDTYLHMPADARDVVAGLRQAVLPNTRDRITTQVAEWADVSAALEQSARQLAAIPSPEALSHLLTSREERRAAVRAAEARMAALNEEVVRLDREEEQLETLINRCYASQREQSHDAEDAHRMLEHIGRVNATLSRFRAALLERHARRIEQLSLDSLQQLLRKEHLVTGLRLDPATYAVTLTGQDGHELPLEQMSAGERQLLATALLWGLRRAAGRIVPLVIDTPLGRLDSSHRTHLITRYFPYASHQTILLSTDEEITGGYYDALRPWVGTELTLSHDETGGTTIIPGYFAQPEEPVHVA